MNGSSILALSLAAALAGGCVTTGTYNAKVAELDQCKGRETELQGKVAALHKQVQEQQAKIAEQEAALAENKKQIDTLTEERAKLTKQRDDQTALVGQLTQRLEKLGQNVDKLTAERGQLAAGLDDAKSRLEELRKQKAAAEARAAVFHNLVQKLRSMIDAGQLKVIIRDGRMLIALPNDVLFDSGKTAVKPDGQVALGKVAQVLGGIPDRHFLVAGHTDNVPIHSSHFASNWELSTARAVEVVKLMTMNGMKPQTLAAAGYSEYDPVVANDSPEHKAQNRRIEIVLQPNLADLPSMDDIK